MLPAVKRAYAGPVLAAMLALAACGGEERTSARNAVAEQVAAVVEELESALEARDYERVCERVLSPEGRRRAGGEECVRRLSRTAAGVDDPSIELLSITVGPQDATARVRALADGERPAIDVIRLTPAEGGYRIESMSGE